MTDHIDIIPLIRTEDFEAGDESCDKCGREQDILFDCDEVLCLKCAVEAHETEMIELVAKAVNTQSTGDMTIVELTAHIKHNTQSN